MSSAATRVDEPGTAPPVRAVLFDFFGTLVEYSASRTEQGYPKTDALLRSAGLTLPYERWLAAWGATWAELDARTADSHEEFSMADAAAGFLGRVDLDADDRLVAEVVTSYLAEWNTGVRHLDEVAPLLERLAGRYRLAVVTNTHDTDLVPDHLAAMGVADHLDVVVTSVEVGLRKPHPAVYREALEQVGAAAAETVFVGDSFEPDYAGPRRAGMRALLIDPDGTHDVPAEHRIISVAEVAERLGAAVSA